MKRIRTKNFSQITTLVIAFIFAFKFFQSTPFEAFFFQIQAGFLIVVLIFLLRFIAFSIKRNRINKIALYYLLIIAIVPFYGAYRASAEFGQPFIYGFLSEREWLLLGAGIYLYYKLTTRKMTFATLESAFVFMAWGSLIVFSVIFHIFDSSQLEGTDEVSHFVTNDENSRGLRFKFQTYFIAFGTIYYCFKYSIERTLKNQVFFCLFLAFILFIVKGRTYIMTIAVTLMLYYWINYSLSRILLISIKVSLFLLLTLIAIQSFMPDYLDRMSNMYLQMFKVLTTGKESEDYSANARIFESLIALNYFNAHPLSVWLGTGSVSHQWNDGYISIFGYFFPEDIGLLGGVFVYGIVGLFFLYLVPLSISIRTLKKIAPKENVFLMSLKYLLVFVLVGSLRGSFFLNAITYMIPLSILRAYLKLQMQAMWWR